MQHTYSSIHLLNLYGVLLKIFAAIVPAASSNLMDKHVTMGTTQINASFSELGHNPELLLWHPNVSLALHDQHTDLLSFKKNA